MKNLFDDSQAKLIGFGPHIVPQHPPPRCKYKAKILWAQQELKDSFIDDFSFTYDLTSNIPTQTPNKICKDFMFAAYQNCQNNPYLDRHRIFKPYNNVTYMGNLL